MDNPSSLPAPDAEPYTPPQSSPESPTPPPSPQTPMEEAPKDNGLPTMNMPTPPTRPVSPQTEPEEYDKPVAYDAKGNPLYAHPPESEQAENEQAEEKQEKSQQNKQQDDEANQRHQESVVKYPDLNLSEGEYVIESVPRDAFGLLEIWGGAILVFAAVGGFAAAFMYGQPISQQTRTAVAVLIGFVGLLALIGAYLFSKIYQGNRVFVTNESIIQLQQSSLSSRSENTISLKNIREVSYNTNSYAATLFNYGTLLLTNEGDVPDVKLVHVSNPKKHADIITNACENYKGHHGGHS